MKKYNIGIMQGRLTPMKGRGIQFFPFDNWKEEFILAKKIGIDEIEFIFDFEDYTNNPLWTLAGVKELKEIIENTGVRIKAVCFDYFMRRCFFKHTDNNLILKENKEILHQVIVNMRKLQIELIEIPLVDASSMKLDEEKAEFKSFLCDFADEFQDIIFGLETDLPPQIFRDFLQEIGRTNVGANYDSGNSSGLGYEPYEEVTTLGDYIFNIHIKDRIYGGSTVALGTGSADFDKLFTGLKKIGYSRSFILQAARGAEGHESDNAINQKDFLQRYINLYL